MNENTEFDISEFDEFNEIPRVNCLNVCPESLHDNFNRFKRKSFSIINYNIRSCRRNFATFLTMLSGLMFQFTIIILCETWLSQSIDFGYDISGYNQLNSYRNKQGGGIKVFYNNEYSTQIIDQFTFINDVFEFDNSKSSPQK